MAAVDAIVHETGDKGLRSGTLGFISSVVIHVAVHGAVALPEGVVD
jgi:hypothetical protein